MLGRQVGKKFRAGQLAEDQLEMLAEIPGMPIEDGTLEAFEYERPL